MKILIFGCMWVDSVHREELLKRWISLHQRLNHGCDFLLMDGGGSPWPTDKLIPDHVKYLTFPDDIGSAVKGGRDGWGRAFTTGLQYAIDNEYDYVVHIEADSLFRLTVPLICEQMQEENIDAMSTEVEGTKYKEHNWIETGLVFLRTQYVAESDLIRRYDWPTLKRYPVTSESVLFQLLGPHLRVMPWRAYRDDGRKLTVENVRQFQFDWITHCWGRIEIYDEWMGFLDVVGEVA